MHMYVQMYKAEYTLYTYENYALHIYVSLFYRVAEIFSGPTSNNLKEEILSHIVKIDSPLCILIATIALAWEWISLTFIR